MAGIAVSIGTKAPLWTLIALSVVSTAVAAPYRPASGALTPEVVGERDLAAANGLFSTAGKPDCRGGAGCRRAAAADARTGHRASP